MNYIVDNIDIDRYNSIEREREKVQSDTQFQNWCKQYHIGSRVEHVDWRAVELTRQYTGYTKWLSSESEKRSWLPEFITKMF